MLSHFNQTATQVKEMSSSSKTASELEKRYVQLTLQFYSIQSSIDFLPLILCHVMVAKGKARHSTCASPQQSFPGLVGGSRGIARPDEIFNPSSDFWASHRVSLQLDMPRRPPKRTPQLAPFNKMDVVVQVPHPIFKSEPSHSLPQNS